MQDPEIAFISGPINTGPQEEYFSHYIPRIDQAISRGDSFVIGPIPTGIDADALSYLLAYPIQATRITICVTPAEDGMWGDRFRASGVNVQVVDGQMSRERDAIMTSISTYDILRVRTKAEAREFYGCFWRDGHVTNTERNWKRRRGIAEDVIVDAKEINQSMGMICTDEEPDAPSPGCLSILSRFWS
ncbi:hypothetical protein N7507_002471 [Penicillium longicatenatum]|nr:hypothetical protein N7507_002471 [Penicillium longicatenatum]